MRLVEYDPGEVELPVQVEGLRQQLDEAMDDEQRKALIDGNGHVWANAKQTLRSIFFGKCWYTESPQDGTDVDVDHFRPKKRVVEASDAINPHPGYWWLAFSPSNFRYSCIVANRRRRDVETGLVGGKADHFPLWDEGKRAWGPEASIDDEEPLYLDPCRTTDVGLITYKDDGEAMPTVGEGEGKKAFTRADRTIAAYNLNHTEFVKARIKLRDEMTNLVADAKRAFNGLDKGDAFHAQTYENAIARLRNMVSRQAPYSGFCIAYLDRLRHMVFLAGVNR